MINTAEVKLKLENFIFSRAAFLQVPVYGVRGYLKTPSQEPYLVVAVFLYNENFAFDDNADSEGESFWAMPEIAGGIKNGWRLPVPGKWQKKI
ncbi:MAG: hypothetical protein J6V32_02500 [Elusimicrobiaceae bacterium]|nr:hypothetical protein [Elusimicrobiaceae bacterium]